MYRGTTPTLCFTIMTNVDLGNVAEFWVTIRNLVGEVTFCAEDIVLDPQNKKAYVRMTQEQTLAFSSGKAKVQARFLTSQGVAYATEIGEIDVKEILRDGVIFAPQSGGQGEETVPENPPALRVDGVDRNYPVSIPLQVNEGLQVAAGGTDNYNSLRNLPRLNGAVLSGNMSMADVGIKTLSLAEIRDMFKGW